MKVGIWIALLAGLVTARHLGAQAPGSFDTNHVTVAGTESFPAVVAVAPSGKVYAGGSFTNFGGTGRAGLARLNPGGAVDTGFTFPVPRVIVPDVIFNGQVLVKGSTNAGSVNAVLPFADGRAVVSGNFTHLGNNAVKPLALATDTGAAAAFDPALDKVEPTQLLAGPTGTFYVGGKGNVESTRLALLRLRQDGSRDGAFMPPSWAQLGYLSGSVVALLAGPGDTLYVVTAGATSGGLVTEIVRLTSTGALDAGFADGGKASMPFSNFGSFAVGPTGQVVLAGVASYRGAALPRKINRLTLAGAVDAGFQPTVDPGQGGRVVGVQADGKVLYTTASVPLSRLNADGSVDTGYANPAKVPVTQTGMTLYSFALGSAQDVYAGGLRFTPSFQVLYGVMHILGDPASAPTIATQPTPQLVTAGARARFEVTAQGAGPFTYQWRRNGTPVPGGTERNLVVQPADAATAGQYTCLVKNALGEVLSAAAALTVVDPLPGTVYRETDFPGGTDAPVRDLQFDGQGALLAVGGFTKFNGQSRVRVARVINDGHVADPAFDTSALAGQLQMFERVWPLASGKVLAAGNLTVNYAGRDHLGALRLGANGVLDTTFNAAGSGGDGLNRFSEGAGGALFVSGGTWNGVALASGYGRLSADGVRDSGFVPTPAFTFANALLALPDGKLLVAGRTNAGGGSGASGVLRLNTDGAQDAAFHRGPLPGVQNPRVNSLLRQPDGRILVGGTFDLTAGVLPRTVGVIRLLSNGQLDPEFNPVPSLSALDNSVGSVLKMALQADGRILIQGSFTSVGGYPRPGLARLWPNGTVDPVFSPGAPAGGPGGSEISALAVTGSNQLFVGGQFHSLEGLPRTNFARLNGGPLQAIPAPPVLASLPARLVVSAGSNVTITVVPGGSGPFQFQWRRNQSTGSVEFQDLPGQTNASLVIPNIRVEDSGLVQVSVVNPGGSVRSQPIPLLVHPVPVIPGRLDRSFAGAGALGGITAEAPDGTLYAALPNGIARILEDGTRDTNFVTPPDLVIADPNSDNSIGALLLQPDGKLVVVGRLSTRTGPCNVPGATCFAPQRGLVRLLPNGQYDPAFIQTNAFSGDAQLKPVAVGMQSDGSLLVAGGFQNFSGRSVTGLARFLPDGRFDDTFSGGGIETVLSNPTRVVPGGVVNLLVLPDDRFYVGGGFSQVKGVVRHGVARLAPNGTLDAGFVPPTDGAIGTGLAGPNLFYQLGPIAPGGGVYIFGTFQSGPGGQVSSALRLRPDGTIDPGFRVQTDFQINTGAVQSDGRLIISGQFTQVNGLARTYLTRLNADGSLDTGFDYQSTGPGVGARLTLVADDKVLAGNLRYFAGPGTAVAAPTLTYTLTGAGLQLSWPAGYKLQRSATLSPPLWQDLNVASGYVAPAGGPLEFFRVITAP